MAADNNSKDELRKKRRAAKKAEEIKFSNNGSDNGMPEIPAPLSWPDVSVGRFLKEEPPEPDYILDGLLIRGSVGGVFATGGTGKTYFLLQLFCYAAISQKFGVFNPTRPNKILYVGCEDPESELHRRIHLIASNNGLLESSELTKNLAVYSGVGKIGSLLMMDGNGNPTTSAYYEWLSKSIGQVSDLDVLILDPMSRLYGLNENDNAHGTYWIHCLERLAQQFNITILFAHHESKATSQNKNLRDSTGRGASSIRDGCRWALSMREMTEADGKKYDVNPREYIEVDISKANYTAKLPNSIYFKRGEGGLLEPINLNMDRIKDMTFALVQELSRATEPVSNPGLPLRPVLINITH